jgi:transposase
MRKFREGMDRRQLSILPASIEEYVPEGDIVRYVDALVDEFDLSAIESKYSRRSKFPAPCPAI